MNTIDRQDQNILQILQRDGRASASSISEQVGLSIPAVSERMKKMNLSEKDLNWYLDTRRFGTVVHSGFGLGLERLIQFITGMKNIRDVIPFPRTPGNCNY